MALHPVDEMNLNRKKVGLLKKLSNEILTLLKHGVVNDLNAALQGSKVELTWRTRVLIGLGIKLCAAYESLMIDARQERAECSHHLKTMAECFIYYHWVAADAGDTNAKLVWADCCRNMAKYYRQNSTIGDFEELARQIEGCAKEVTEGIEDQWGKFSKKNIETLAIECQVDTHYRRVYRLACGGAHLTDLSNYMPPAYQAPVTLEPVVGQLMAYVALGHASHIGCNIAQDASTWLNMGFDEIIAGFRKRLSDIEALTS